MANNDIVVALDSRQNEIIDFLKYTSEEISARESSLEELRTQRRDAERDLKRVQRAMASLQGDDEPQEAAMVKAINDLAGIEEGSQLAPGRLMGMSAPTPAYHPHNK